MQVHFNKGLHVGKTFSVDTVRKTPFAKNIISHAHSDHVHVSKEAKVYCTPETLSLVETNFSKPEHAKSVPLGKRFSIQDYSLSFHPAGHILGSAQVWVENGSTLAYTGDLKLQESLTEKPAEILHPDILVMESTFGMPQYVFPDRAKTYAEMKQWCSRELSQGHYVVFSGYALGKAQELTAFCNEHLGISPLVHERIFANNQIYQKHNARIGSSIKLDHNLKDSQILIMPSSLLNAHLLQVLECSLHQKVVTAKATGWPYSGFYDRIFPLSDHADFSQLMFYVKEAQPKRVYTVYGFANELAWHIRKKLGIPARPLQGVHAQSILGEFQ